MNALNMPPWMKGLSGNGQALAAPILIIMLLAMMILPLPAFVLDLFFSFNIALSIIVLLTSLYTVKPLDFMAFPTVLLVSTMLRLSLNVASTRVVLTEGHTGPDAAGKVIEAFGHFLIGGNYTVGIVVFVILTIINFVVVTKGAGRIAEVGARFALDAMPGKQMAIDADLNAGLIGEAEAKRRRWREHCTSIPTSATKSRRACTPPWRKCWRMCSRSRPIVQASVTQTVRPGSMCRMIWTH